jgi:3-hydroxyisobutyrate dehydrogenase
MENKIALLGVGLMGSRIAERLANNGFQVSVYNRTISKAKELEKFNITVCEDVKSAVQRSEIIITMLSDYKALNNVLFADTAISYQGKIVIQMSTVAPDQNLLLKKEIEKLGGSFVEAPVLGGITQAKSGELIVMVGSSKAQFEELKGLFSIIGNNVKYIGQTGQAAAIKLSYNQLIATMNTAFCMSLGYVMDKGINLNIFMDILRSSTLYAPAFDKKLDNFVNRDYENTNFSLKLLLKDVNLVVDELEKSRVDCLTLKGVKFLLERGIHFEQGEKDYSALFEMIYPKK